MGPTWGPPGSCRPQEGGPCWPREHCYLGGHKLPSMNNAIDPICEKNNQVNFHQWLLTWPGNWVNIGSGNGLSPGRRQAITWANDDLLSVGPLGTNFSEIRIKIHNFSFMKMSLKISPVAWRPFCPDEIYTGPEIGYNCACRCHS